MLTEQYCRAMQNCPIMPRETNRHIHSLRCCERPVGLRIGLLGNEILFVSKIVFIDIVDRRVVAKVLER